MNLSEEKRRFRRIVVTSGAETAQELPEDAAPTRAEGAAWLRDFNRKPIGLSEVPSSPRLVNHFALGADPEFGFYDPALGGRVDASALALQAGVAFGADNNGRLAELRPQPSRFVLDIVASLLAELRWLYISRPATSKYQWMSTPAFEGDGLGGHVHFGRKRGRFRRTEGLQWIPADETSKSTLRALDGIYQKAGLWFTGDSLERRRRAPGHYGQPTDVRIQKHGFEYRSWPTWLESPWLAYFHLTLAKLAAYDPELLPKNGLRLQHIVNLLTYYQHRDDDALIAKRAYLLHGLPKCQYVPLQGKWGLPTQRPLLLPGVTLFPSFIVPSMAEKQAIFNHLVKGNEIAWSTPVPYWPVQNPPAGFVHALDTFSTIRQPGMGELFNGLVFHRRIPITVARHGHGLGLGSNLLGAETIEKAVRERFGVAVTVRPGTHLHFGEELLSSQNLPRLREFLLSGLLPIWEAGNATEAKYQEYKEQFAGQTVRYRGHALEVA